MSSSTRVMVVHPGHAFSTTDVFDGMCAGLALNGVDVVPFTWDRILQTLTTLVRGAIAGGVVQADRGERLFQFVSWIGSADALSVALDQEVDAIVVVNGLLFPPSRVGILRQLGVPVACYGTEAPYFLKAEREIAPFYSHWLTNERRCVADFTGGQARVTYLPHAYNPQVHVAAPPSADHAADVVFVGGGYPERKALLEGVAWGDTRLVTRGTLWHLDLNAERAAGDIGRGHRYAEGSIPNDETSAWHRSSKIALNLHRRMTYIETGEMIPHGVAESLGPRAYEIPAVGGFMLCDDERAELREVYGDAAATFRAWDSADLERQARYWLAHDDAREARRRAQAEAIRPHHWGARARQLLEFIL